jgi:hypothetical protein
MISHRKLAACTVCLLGICIGLSEAKPEESRGTFLEELTFGCSEENVTISGSDRDITLYRGQSDGVDVSQPEVTWYCGKYEEQARCPTDTNNVWVTRTDSRTLYFACYER